MGFLCLGSRGRFTGADRPNRFVCNNGLGHLFLAQAGQTPAHLAFQDFFHLARFTFRECFADADNRLEGCGMRRSRFS